MSAPSSIAIDALVIATILVAILLLFIVVVIRRARDRRRQLSEDLAADRHVVQDRAFNAVRLATTEATVLEREGVDTTAPRGLLEQAEGAMKRGDHYHALTLGRSAHEALVRLRHQTSPSPLEPVPGGAARPAAGSGSPRGAPRMSLDVDEERPLAGAELPPASASGVPKNRVEAQFQLRLLGEELAQAERHRPARPEVTEASRLQVAAQASQEKGEHTEALRLALKGRRSIGSRLELLPPTPPRAPTAPAASVPDRPGTTRLPPSAPPGGAPTCARCGKPTKASDLFCRSCGAPVGSARCPRCQAELEPEDRFCPRCGAPTG